MFPPKPQCVCKQQEIIEPLFQSRVKFRPKNAFLEPAQEVLNNYTVISNWKGLSLTGKEEITTHGIFPYFSRSEEGYRYWIEWLNPLYSRHHEKALPFPPQEATSNQLNNLSEKVFKEEMLRMSNESKETMKWTAGKTQKNVRKKKA